MNPEDKRDGEAEGVGPEVRPMDAPGGLALHPQPEKVVRLSRRTSIAIAVIGVAVLLGFAWGGIRRAAKAQAAVRDAGLPKNVAPATQAGREFTSVIPLGNAAVVRRTAEGAAPELQPPGVPPQQTSTMAPCGTDPRTGQPWLYNPQTGQPCDGLPQERIVVRQVPANRMPSGQPATIQLQSEPTPEERRVAAARQREQEPSFPPPVWAAARRQ